MSRREKWSVPKTIDKKISEHEDIKPCKELIRWWFRVKGIPLKFYNQSLTPN